MAIRQLPFDKGEEFELRKKAVRIPPAEAEEILANLKKNLESEAPLIIKCGKSFWDVTGYPEIFEAGDEFRVEDLTSIDRKQMTKPEAPKPAFEETPAPEAPVNPLSELYHRTDEEEAVDPQEFLDTLERKTYYLRKVQIEELTILCHDMRVETSAMVREIFDRGLKSIAEEIGYESNTKEAGFNGLYADAKENLIKKGFTGLKKSFRKAMK